MRTDEQAGQAAKHILKSYQDDIRRDGDLHPDSAMPHMRPDERLRALDAIALLKKVCGIAT